MGSAINVDKLASAVIKELELYKNATADVVDDAVKKTAKETAKEVNERASQVFGGKDYAKSWTYSRDSNKRSKNRFSMVVHSKAPYYRLAHLLENGHAKVNGGRVAGRPHIAPASEKAAEVLNQHITEGMKSI